MNVTLLVWLASFAGVAVLLGLTMYGLICLSDLENDFINPHDSATRINAGVNPEAAIQAALTALYLVTGNWLSFLYSVPMLAYNVRLYMRGEQRVHVTDIFSQLSLRKKVFLLKLFYYLIFFVFVIYSLVKIVVILAVADEGGP